MLEKTPYYSYAIGSLSKGCNQCVKGQKLVLFVTGLCGHGCYFCPLSEEKKDKDVEFANERPITNPNDIITEAKISGAKGAGITGGDPLVVIDRTCEYIKLLKKEFGSHFHIHLYTPLDLVDEERLKKLSESGLDEIRFHPDFDQKTTWKKIELAKKYIWDIGIEVPVIPDKKNELKELIIWAKDKVDFINLNELEYSDTNSDKMDNLETKDELSYAINGSEELALEIMNSIDNETDNEIDNKIGNKTDNETDNKIGNKIGNKNHQNIHYCTATLKDKVQLAQRIKRTSKLVALPIDKITEEGILIRGAIYLAELKPETSYRKKIAKADKPKTIEKLLRLKKEIQKKFKLTERQIFLDERKLRLLVRIKDIEKISKKIDNPCAIIEEYPTWDQFEISVEML